eukprot:EG_transcript_2266
MTSPYFLPLIRKTVSPTKRSRAGAPWREKESFRSEAASATPTKPAAPRKPIRGNELTALATLFKPPPDLNSKVRIPTEHYDLRWLFRPPRAPPPPAKRLTLLTLRVDLFATPAISAKDSLRVQRAVLLNSPRSVLVLLRNGVQVEALQRRTLEQYRQQGSLEGVIPEAVEKRFETLERKRQRLLAELVEEYKWQCEQLPLEDIVAFFDVAAADELGRTDPSLALSLSHPPATASTAATSPSPSRPAEETEVLRPVPASAPALPSAPELQPTPTEATPAMHRQATPPPLSAEHLLDFEGPRGRPDRDSPKSVRSCPTVSSAYPKSQGESGSPYEQFTAKKVEDSRARVNRLVESNLTARERAAEKRKQNLALSILRVLEFERSVTERKEVLAAQSAARAEALRQSAEQHQQKAALRQRELQDKMLETVARKHAADNVRMQAVETVSAQRQSLAARNKQRREEKRNMILLKQVVAEEQRYMEHEVREKEREEHLSKLQEERQARQAELKRRLEEQEQKRLVVQQRSALLDLHRRLQIEDRTERQQKRVDVFMMHKGSDGVQKRAEEGQQREEKRKRAYTAARQHETERRNEVLAKMEAFEERYTEMQQSKEFEGHLREEEHRLRLLDKQQFRERRQNQMEFDKLLLVDQLQRKVERIDKAESSKEAVMLTIRQEYEEKLRERDRLLAEMEAEEIESRKRMTAVLFTPTKKGPGSRSPSSSPKTSHSS